MIATFTALLFAHVLADFVLQTDRMVETKRAPATLALHFVIVAATAYLALGRLDMWEPLALAAAHILIDTIKVYALPERLASFMADQTAHLLTLIAVAWITPDLFAGGLWSDLTPLPALMCVASGFVLATFAGAHVLRLLVKRWQDADIAFPIGLPNGGRLIGLLERGIIFMLVLSGNPAGVGFLIAAKSVLRFETTRDDQTAGEYVIIGTLASFGWALAVSWLTVWLLSFLPPLGFPPLTP